MGGGDDTEGRLKADDAISWTAAFDGPCPSAAASGELLFCDVSAPSMLSSSLFLVLGSGEGGW